ncbi:MAG: type IX secretion system membrane protein PorP/SprF [Cyclobacteriaceae bacterium]|nr:type IX secretion system membrane protein PorP/SprF [Cyclobacteriaceae bacterium]
MNRKFLLSIIFSVTLLNLCQAQQDPLYSQYMFNMLGVNPAYAGNRDVLSVTGLYRLQWVGVPGAPVTQMISIDSPLPNKKVGLGLQILNDEIGINKTTGVYGSYSYKLKFNKGTLALGIQGGFTRFYANYQTLQLSGSQVDNAFNQTLDDFQPNIGAGAFYSTDRFYVGFSSPHILGQGTFYSESNVSKDLSRQNAHWFLASGYVFSVSPAVDLKPSALIRMVQGSPINVDVNLNAWFYRTIGLGASVRSSSIISSMLEIQLNNQFRVGYAYDWTLSELRNSGSHEIMLRYEFGYEKKRMISPRFF